MCTAITYQTKDFYFGRTLDHHVSYGEEVVVMPRSFPLAFRHEGRCDRHYAAIGMAVVPRGYPLYYDAVNECGLCVAGLRFAKNAVYRPAQAGKCNLAQFELIPFLLAKCADVGEAKEYLSRLNVTDEAYAEDMPPAPLHWLIADEREAIVVEPLAGGVSVRENPVGVMTNDPPFSEQIAQLARHMALSPRSPKNAFCPALDLRPSGLGSGAFGLPGDLSSQSRFVRAAFVRCNARSDGGEEESVNAFFHILGSVEQVRGCCVGDNGEEEVTLYSSCCNARTGTYYYTTYENHAVTAVPMGEREGTKLVRFPLERRERIFRAAGALADEGRLRCN